MRQAEFIQALNEEMLEDSALCINLSNGYSEYLVKTIDGYIYKDNATEAPAYDDDAEFDTFEELKENIAEKQLYIISIDIQNRNMKDTISAEDLIAFYS